MQKRIKLQCIKGCGENINHEELKNWKEHINRTVFSIYLPLPTFSGLAEKEQTQYAVSQF